MAIRRPSGHTPSTGAAQADAPPLRDWLQVRHAGLDRLGWGLFLLAITAYLTLSSLTLAHWGVRYDQPGGSPVVKLHPGTWLLVLAAGCSLAARGHPVLVLTRLLQAAPLLALYAAAMGFVGLWSVGRHGTSGSAFVIDSLWMPGFAMLVLSLQPAHRLRMVAHLALGLLACNAAIGLVEYGMRTALVPRYPIDSGLIPDASFFRSSALLGHPLANALVTATLLPWVLLLRNPALRWGLVLMLLLALLAFGSRTALAVVLVVYGGAGLVWVTLAALSGRYSYLQMSGGLLAAALAVTAVVGSVWASGLGERVFASLTWDNSANVRLVAWEALERLDSEGWWIGVTPARIETIATAIGLDLRYEAIENFWIVLLMQMGVVGFLPFMVGLAAGLWHASRRALPMLRIAVPAYLLVASGANTLASKTVSLTLLCALLLASAAWRLAPQPGARRPASRALQARGAAPSAALFGMRWARRYGGRASQGRWA